MDKMHEQDTGISERKIFQRWEERKGKKGGLAIYS